MFDVGADELLLVAVIAILVIGPKDLPMALRTAGRWIAKVRRVSGHFRSGVEAMIREAELAEMEQKWKQQNERIMAEHPHEQMTAQTASGEDPVKPAEPAAPAAADAPKQD
jgi:sec-independent protein translocase protein TatB